MTMATTQLPAPKVGQGQSQRLWQGKGSHEKAERMMWALIRVTAKISALCAYRTNLSPFTKDFRVQGALNELSHIYLWSLLAQALILVQ